MFENVRFFTICFFSAALTACATHEVHDQNFPGSYSYQPSQYQNIESPNYDYSSGYSESTATVPDSHYTGSYRSPTSHKDMDRNWVDSQNPKSYTIQIGESDKASQVAGRLYKAPKTERSAEIKYDRKGQSYYKGVYGSFNNQEDAQKALNSLPPEIKQGSEIKSWSSLQEKEH